MGKFRYQHITSSVKDKIPENLYTAEIAVNTYPGFEKPEHLANYTHRGVETDEMLITAKSPAFTLEFALKIVEALKGIDAVNQVKNGLCI